MPDAASLLTFSALAFAVIVVPGPGVLFIVGRAIALGRRAALLTVFGNAGGLYVQVAVVALGLGTLLERSITLYTAVKWAGAAYLVWLGIQAIRHRHDGLDASDDPTDARTGSVLREGFLVGLLNPKTLALFSALLPQFVNPDGAAIGAQLAGLGALFVAIAIVADSVWALAAGTARAWLADAPGRVGAMGATGGLVMIGLGLRLAFTGRPD